ncbi:MAG: hypothetical protein ICV81_19315, partial [Flavisolibacter sp.]|nr:hypothetical protein [Flavisolibacter sp.]
MQLFCKVASFVKYIKEYVRWLDGYTFLFSALFMALAIFVNYYFGVEKSIQQLPVLLQIACWYFIFLLCFSVPYLLCAIRKKPLRPSSPTFRLIYFIAPAIFAWKMAGTVDVPFSSNENLNDYWNNVIYWPFKLVVVTGLLLIIWRLYFRDEPFFGFTTKNLHVRIYFYMLLVMVPLVAAAATQPDFQAMYPRMQHVQHLFDDNIGWKKLLYELSYGSDFFTIELFFRGFLVLAFAKWVGKGAILPMALFYCSILF